MPRCLPLLAGICLALSITESRAENRLAAAILKLPISVRQVGMGDLSLGKDDVLRTWSNPAVLAAQETKGAVAIGGASQFGGENRIMGLAAGWRADSRLAIGALASLYGVSIPEIDAYGDAVGSTFERSTFVGGLVAAARPIEWLCVGATGKAVADSIDQDRENVVALDAGIAGFFESVSVGAALRNIGKEIYPVGDTGAAASSLPKEFRIAAAYRHKPYMATVGVEYVRSTGVEDRVAAGIEWWPGKILAIRAGMAAISGNQKGISAGLSTIYRVVGLDYAFSAHPLGATHRASLSYAFDRPAAGKLAAAEGGAVGLEEEYQRALADFKAGKHDRSFARIERILAADPGHWRAWTLAGNYHYKMNNMAAARRAYERALEINPENQKLKNWLEEILEE